MNFNSQKSNNTNFLDLLVKEVKFEYKLKKYKMAKKTCESMAYEVDDMNRFRNSLYIYENNKKKEKNEKIKKEVNKKNVKNEYSLEKINGIHPVDVINWEENIYKERKMPDVQIREFVKKLLEGNWEENIVYDKNLPYKSMSLYLNDPNLIFENLERKNKIKKKHYKNTNFDKPLKNKYNISNDKYYDAEIKTKTSLVSFGVQHSVPALKLNSKFFRINQTKEELRNFHRPSLALENKKYIFSNPMQITAKTGIIRKPYEITCNDLTDFVVFEYSEEYPLFVVNPGMVSLLNKYYRKLDENDDLAIKDAIVLENDDEGPFLGYGYVPKGTSMQTIDNNLFVSPVFKHKTDDYLIITTENKLIYRKINNLYLVGQELPKDEVYAPHSRKLNQFCKDRLKVAAYRVYNKKKELLMSQLDIALPHFSEGSKRKWLKEYSDAIKKGKDTLYMVKDNCFSLSEEELRKLVTPENICQYQSMLAGERRMEDLGYKITEDENEDNEVIPPWILSRNFVNSTNGRGLLELKGFHDPTGIGEGFSFSKVKFKKQSEAENRKMFSEHQNNYKNEIEKIWIKQLDSLNKKDTPHISRENKVKKEAQAQFNESNVLTIKRTYLINNEITVKTTKIYDIKVINAYLKARKKNKPEDKKPTLTCSSCNQSGHMKTNKNCPNYQGPKKKLNEKKPLVILQEKILKLISQFMQIPFSSPFHRPVNLKKFPMYSKIVKNSIDFQTMRKKAKSQGYKNYNEFIDDLNLMYNNCTLFNGKNHSLSGISKEFLDKSINYKNNNLKELTELEEKIN